jgi:uncharacterized protein YjbI with pentapeptide repeats
MKLSEANLRKADLIGADLERANLGRTILSKVKNFTNLRRGGYGKRSNCLKNIFEPNYFIEIIIL